MTDAEHMAAYAREHFQSTVGDAETAEEIGRALISKSSAGPRLWAGIRILRSLGILVEGSERPT